MIWCFLTPHLFGTAPSRSQHFQRIEGEDFFSQDIWGKKSINFSFLYFQKASGFHKWGIKLMTQPSLVFLLVHATTLVNKSNFFLCMIKIYDIYRGTSQSVRVHLFQDNLASEFYWWHLPLTRLQEQKMHKSSGSQFHNFGICTLFRQAQAAFAWLSRHFSISLLTHEYK